MYREVICNESSRTSIVRSSSVAVSRTLPVLAEHHPKHVLPLSMSSRLCMQQGKRRHAHRGTTSPPVYQLHSPPVLRFHLLRVPLPLVRPLRSSTRAHLPRSSHARPVSHLRIRCIPRQLPLVLPFHFLPVLPPPPPPCVTRVPPSLTSPYLRLLQLSAALPLMFPRPPPPQERLVLERGLHLAAMQSL